MSKVRKPKVDSWPGTDGGTTILEKKETTIHKTHQNYVIRHIRFLRLMRNALRHHKTYKEFPLGYSLVTWQFVGLYPLLFANSCNWRCVRITCRPLR